MVKCTREAIVVRLGNRYVVTRKMRTIIIARGIMNQRLSRRIRAMIMTHVRQKARE